MLPGASSLQSILAFRDTNCGSKDSGRMKCESWFFVGVLSLKRATSIAVGSKYVAQYRKVALGLAFSIQHWECIFLYLNLWAENRFSWRVYGWLAYWKVWCIVYESESMPGSNWLHCTEISDNVMDPNLNIRLKWFRVRNWLNALECGRRPATMLLLIDTCLLF